MSGSRIADVPSAPQPDAVSYNDEFVDLARGLMV